MLNTSFRKCSMISMISMTAMVQQHLSCCYNELARWAPTSYTWPYKCVTGVISCYFTLLIGAITPFLTGDGAHLVRSKMLFRPRRFFAASVSKRAQMSGLPQDSCRGFMTKIRATRSTILHGCQARAAGEACVKNLGDVYFFF